MDPAALASLCLLLSRNASADPLPAGVTCPARTSAVLSSARPGSPMTGAGLAARVASAEARDGIARVAYAEAANQGDSGLAGVVYTILNRLQDGRWGSSVDSVLNAPAQFEPVLRVGGTWRNLRPVSDAQRARIDTILNLALEGRLPDLTNGARYFQNATIVAQREAAGAVSRGLTNFGGAVPSATIGAHTFYAETGRRGRPGAGVRTAANSTPAVSMFVGEVRAVSSVSGGRQQATTDDAENLLTPLPPNADKAPSPVIPAPRSADPVRGIFVLTDGRTSDRLD